MTPRIRLYKKRKNSDVMSEINDRTPNLNLAQPHVDNDLVVDVLRIRESFSKLDVAVHEKAPLDSPELTGIPKAPTPAPGADNNQIATVAAVASAIGAAIEELVNSSPDVLDTLNELAQALGGDPNFATTVTNAIAGKMDKLPSGTKMLFVQSNAPPGWTKDTTQDDKALRIVSGAASSGGTTGFTSVFASNRVVAGVVSDTTLTLEQIPSHSHSGLVHNFAAPAWGHSGSSWVFNANVAIGYSGGGAAHNHSFTGTGMNFAVKYVDAIIATKN